MATSELSGNAELDRSAFVAPPTRSAEAVTE
jgi:hypothetical protein